MGVYAVTGGATGIGAAVTKKLRGDGHQAVVIDIKEADITADLSTDEGRRLALDKIHQAAPKGLDGLITCAGVGANVSDNLLVTRLNYTGTIALIKGCQDMLEAKGGAVVLVSSTAATTTGTPEFVDALLDDDIEKATSYAEKMPGHAVYSGTKQAVNRWMRRHITEYASKGVRLNAIAPGYTETPLNAVAEQTAEYGDAIRDFKASIPVGFSATAEDQAAVACFLLSDAARFVCGSVLFVDGGHDARVRPDIF